MGDIIFKWYCDGAIVVSKGDNYNTMETIMLYFFIARTNYIVGITLSCSVVLFGNSALRYKYNRGVGMVGKVGRASFFGGKWAVNEGQALLVDWKVGGNHCKLNGASSRKGQACGWGYQAIKTYKAQKM
jgi:hypothetical protein